MFYMLFLLVVSIVFLYFGAEFSLNASEKIGKRLGMSPLLVGMLLVGFGTSLPEFFVSHLAAFENNPSVAYGGLVGSNIANLLLVLGVSAFITKLNLGEQNLRGHIFLHTILSLTLIYVLTRQVLDIMTIIPLIVIILIYLKLLFNEMKVEVAREDEEQKTSNLNLAMSLIVGFSFLFIGGKYLVVSVIDICEYYQIAPYIISAIVIALGTSFPELVTAVLAAVKKKDSDLIVGNIIGSNIFNCALILSSLFFYKFPIAQNFKYELIALNVGSSILLLLMFMKSYLGKFTGFIFLCLYGGMVYLWMCQA